MGSIIWCDRIKYVVREDTVDLLADLAAFNPFLPVHVVEEADDRCVWLISQHITSVEPHNVRSAEDIAGKPLIFPLPWWAQDDVHLEVITKNKGKGHRESFGIALVMDHGYTTREDAATVARTMKLEWANDA